LLAIVDLKTKQQEITSFTTGNTVLGYSINIDNNRQVTLTKNYSQQIQTIILTMYQTNKEKS
jgi:hypothetical protein